MLAQTSPNRLPHLLARFLTAIALAAGSLGAAPRPIARPSLPLAPASPFTVTKTDDTADGTCDADCSLREAIIAANNQAGADTVLVPDGVYTLTLAGTGENLAATGDLDLLDDVALTGAGAALTVIDADQLDRVFHVHTGVTATLSGVRIQHGEAPHSSLADPAVGGGLFSAGTLTVTDSFVSNNEAVEGGGLGSLTGARLALVNSEVVSNTAIAGGGLFVFAGELRITDSFIAYNQYGDEGGGVLSGAATTILNTTVAHNTTASPAFSFGGGLLLKSDEPVLVESSQVFSNTAWAGAGLWTVGNQIAISATTVTTNTATGFGGGIFNASPLNAGLAGGHVTLNHVTISANTVVTAGAGIFNQAELTLIDSDLSDNAAGQHGGGLYSGNYAPFTNGLTATVEISQSMVSGNSAEMGGGLYNADGNLAVYHSDLFTNTATTAGGIYNLHRLTIDHSTIAGNVASEDAGGIASSGQLTLTNSLVAYNQAAAYTGGVYSEENTSKGLLAPSLIQNSTISGNSAGAGGGLYLRTTMLDNSGVTSNMAQFGGGLIGTGPLTLTSSSIVSNTATEDGGGLHLSGGGLQIVDTIIAGNTAAQDGGGLHLNGGALQLSGTTVANNSAAQHGGGVYGLGELSIVSSTLTANTAESFGGGLYNLAWASLEGGEVTGNEAAVGGGIYNNRLLAITGTVFSANQATLLGGGLATNHQILDGPDPDPIWYVATIHQATFAGNSAMYGGGIFAESTLTVTESTFITNTASQKGGGLFRYEETPHPVLVSATQFISNTAFEGGGLANGTGHLTLHTSQFISNSAAAGGGLFNGANVVLPGVVTPVVTITAGYFAANTSDAGAGLANGPAAYLLLSGSDVVSNTSPVAGGLWNRGELTIAGSTIAYNQASLSGAGIVNTGTLTMTQSLLAYNVTGGKAGGLWHEAGGGPSLIQDSHIFSNTATHGGGVYVHSGALALDGSTVASNTVSADGGGLYSQGTLTLTNVTVSANSAAGSGGGQFQVNALGAYSRWNNVTFTANQVVSGDGGGVSVAGGTLELSNSILADNTDLGGQTSDCAGTVTSQGYNLIERMQGCTKAGPATGDQDHGVELWPLGDYGGPTWTHAASSTNQNIINVGSPDEPGSSATACETTDQRGVPRPQGGRCDIGAFENELPSLNFQSAVYTYTESTPQAALTVTLSAPSGLTVTVAFGTGDATAQAGNDYVFTQGYLVFVPGQTSAVINVPLLADADHESNESFLVAMDSNVNSVDNAIGGEPNPVQVIILDDDSPPTAQFSSAAYTATETAGTTVITVTLNAAAGLTATVAYSTTGGTAAGGLDYTPLSGTLSFTPGQITATLALPLLGDSLDETDETVQVQLLDPQAASLGTLASTTVTLVDDDDPPQVRFTQAVYTATESTLTSPITVELSAPSAFTVTVDFSTAEAASDDYTPVSGTLTFAPGDTRAAFEVVLTPDSLNENNEAVPLTLSTPSQASLGSPSSAILTIQDDDAPPTVQFSTAAYTITEGAGPAVFTVTLSAASGFTVTVAYSTSAASASPGSDYLPAAGTLTFPPGMQLITGTVTVLNDADFEAPETLNLALSAPAYAVLAAPFSASLTLLSDDPYRLSLPLIVGRWFDPPWTKGPG